jgi:pyridoxal phosphate enzyme (YggS family)
LLEKKQALQDLDITWHFIGTLQTKKIKKVANEIDYLHSIHKLKTAKELNKRLDHPLKCMLQVNISDESTKHGFLPNDVIPALKEIQSLDNIEIIGLMGMATHTSDVSLIDNQFQLINDLERKIKQTLGLIVNQHSIGMSNDYLIALKHNARFIRLGSVLFKKEV